MEGRPSVDVLWKEDNLMKEDLPKVSYGEKTCQNCFTENGSSSSLLWRKYLLKVHNEEKSSMEERSSRSLHFLSP